PLPHRRGADPPVGRKLGRPAGPHHTEWRSPLTSAAAPGFLCAPRRSAGNFTGRRTTKTRAPRKPNARAKLKRLLAVALDPSRLPGREPAHPRRGGARTG